MLPAQPVVWIVMLVTLAWTPQVDAQLAFIARHAIGRVEQMSQQQGNGGVAYDTAAVVVEVPAEKVYAVALRNLSAQPQLRITGQDQQNRVIQFTNSVQIAGLQVNPLSDKLSQILITSAHTGSQENVSGLILERILRFCSEMKVKCSRAQSNATRAVVEDLDMTSDTDSTVSLRQPSRPHRSGWVPSVNTARCTGCGWCVAACDLHLLSLEVVRWRKTSVLHDPHRCTGCSDCAVACPFHVIRMAKG